MAARLLLLLALVSVPCAATFNFLAVGDWGGQDTTPYTSTGEVLAAAGMGIIARQLQAHFILGLGDNFYYTGIQGDDTNFRFDATFEDVYTDSALQVPWYLIAGNHDHGGNVTAQIAYTQVSKRWRFPNYYYKITETFTDETGATKTLDLVFIDTVLLAGNTDDNEDMFAAPPGAADPQAAEDQWQWIEQQLAGSTAAYLWVVGHYPIYSACEHGPTDVLVSRLKPMLIKHKATGYLSGHDHCLEYIDDGAGPLHVLSGAGKECCYNSTNINKCPQGSIKYLLANSQPAGGVQGGFVSFQLGGRSMAVDYYDQAGRVLFTTPAMAPRN